MGGGRCAAHAALRYGGGGPWAWGCFACNASGNLVTKVARIEADERVTIGACQLHAKSKVHRRSVEILQARHATAELVEIVPVSAEEISERVLRLSRWALAASLIEQFSSLHDFERTANASGVGNIYDEAGPLVIFAMAAAVQREAFQRRTTW